MKPVRRDVAGLMPLRTRQQLNHRWLPVILSKAKNLILQILHSACGFVQDDRECILLSVFSVILSKAKNLMLQILHSACGFVQDDIRTANRVISHCAVFQWITKS